MNFLKRDLAPVIDQAWTQIENEVKRVLAANLSARRLVDFQGPKGFNYSAANLGTLSAVERAEGDVYFGIRQVQPLIEIRVPFQMKTWDLDNFARGATNVDLDPAVQAALKLASFEDKAIYLGFARAGITGLSQAVEQPPIRLGSDASAYPDAVARAVLQLSDRGVGGPYGLVLGPEPYRKLLGDVSHYPPRQRVAQIIEGPILHSPVLQGGFLTSLRGGDYELVVGQDVSIGYDHHAVDQTSVSLFLTESFTFRVLTPEAAVPLSP